MILLLVYILVMYSLKWLDSFETVSVGGCEQLALSSKAKNHQCSQSVGSISSCQRSNSFIMCHAVTGLFVKSDALSLLRNSNMQLEDELKVTILVRSIILASLDHSCNKILYGKTFPVVYVTMYFHVCEGNTVIPFSVCDILCL